MDIEVLNNKYITKVSVIGIIFNIFLFLAKFIIGHIFSIHSLIVDSVHSVSDSLSSILGYIGSKIALKDCNKKHPYGYGKIEYIFSLIIGIFMMIACIIMLISSIESLIKLDKMVFSYTVLIVCIINVTIKFSLYIYTRNKYIKTHSIIIKAIMTDHRNDCIITLFTIFSIVISYMGFGYMDGICGVFLSFLIGISGMKIFLKSCEVLIDISMDEKTINEIKNYIEKFDGIQNVNSIISRKLSCNYIAIINISMDGKCSLNNIYNITSIIKEEILNKFSEIKNIIINVIPN